MTHSGIVLTARSLDEVFDRLATPERFAPLLPGFESMAMQDPTHFSLRTAIMLAQIHGHANLAMELQDALRPHLVAYRGEGIVAGSQLKLGLQFSVAAVDGMTEVSWRGEFSLDGMLAFMAAGLIEPMGREHFDIMAEHLRESLHVVEAAAEPPGQSETGA
ncbi:MAG TPA: SRPBCC domain-containing protein [Candidatus Eisenbacteria bacterium]|nr:SRPBCC domain-containing protein [Candidatus Eisenbacteria bacterium]